MNIKVKQSIKEIDNAIQLAESQEDDELKSHLANLVCIRVSGLVENFLKTRISDYSDKKVPKPVSRYLSHKFADITNLKESKLRDTLGLFSTEWQEQFVMFIQDNQQLKASLDSIITNRNNIAHGQHVSLTLKSVKQYYDDIKKVIKELDKIIK